MIIEMKRVYLDVCCLNRPFDDQDRTESILNQKR